VSIIEMRISSLDGVEPLQVSINKASRLLDYSTRHIRRLLDTHELESVGQGRSLRITMASIRAFQERHLNEISTHAR
jgi:hypothetical protein